MYKLSLGLKSNHSPVIQFNNEEKDKINSSIDQLIKNQKLRWSFNLEKPVKLTILFQCKLTTSFGVN